MNRIFVVSSIVFATALILFFKADVLFQIIGLRTIYYNFGLMAAVAVFVMAYLRVRRMLVGTERTYGFILVIGAFVCGLLGRAMPFLDGGILSALFPAHVLLIFLGSFAILILLRLVFNRPHRYWEYVIALDLLIFAPLMILGVSSRAWHYALKAQTVYEGNLYYAETQDSISDGVTLRLYECDGYGFWCQEVEKMFNYQAYEDKSGSKEMILATRNGELSIMVDEEVILRHQRDG